MDVNMWNCMCVWIENYCIWKWVSRRYSHPHTTFISYRYCECYSAKERWHCKAAFAMQKYQRQNYRIKQAKYYERHRGHHEHLLPPACCTAFVIDFALLLYPRPCSFTGRTFHVRSFRGIFWSPWVTNNIIWAKSASQINCPLSMAAVSWSWWQQKQEWNVMLSGTKAPPWWRRGYVA